ncbi:GPI transamidase component PIG-T [Multifurca ochricompacta]|uniref:GPI transamidase component PIG-T n=1 Tax=Multifurca ochricompacta TaxID=376703 RepID=A0AAD4LRS4_9AGAM|nr:GPI transamidase component PIG-T [Multifurca ochricompacta]
MKWSLICFFLAKGLAAKAAEEYREELTLPVPRAPGSLGTDDISQHYTIFPLALGQILREHAIPEFHLTMNSGKWDYDRWGYPGEAGVGSGAELWAWMGDGAQKSIDERWKELQNSLSGLFCASLGNMDNLHTTSPTRIFPPTGHLPRLTPPHTHSLRHATLPAERVCTENLTPFLKLLPCTARAGIAALLEPHRIFDADWHGLGVHVRWLARSGVELTLTVQAVLDPVRTSAERRRDWTLRSLFDRTIPHACHIASSSVVRIMLPSSSEVGAYTLTPEPETLDDQAGFAVYDLTNGECTQKRSTFQALDVSSLADLSIRRTLKGSSQTHGVLSIVIRNNQPVTIRTHYLETMPWHVEFFLHTLRVSCGDGTNCDYLFTNMTYTPSQPHANPALLQATLEVPPLETLHLSLRVRKVFLRYTEHPPDAQRGWDLPPAVFVPVDAPHRRIYTSALLVDLATPDFSMPYNVIIMSSTLIALIFGSLFNMLIRRFVLIKVDEVDERVNR